jgi:hypothetical protein
MSILMPKTFLAHLLFFFAGFQGAKFDLEYRRSPRNAPIESKRRISCIYYEFGDAVPLAEEGLGGMEAMVRKRTDVWDWWTHGLNRTMQGLFGERSEC